MLGGGFAMFFDTGLFEVVFFLMFSLIFLLFLVTLFRSAKEWHRNNQSPRLEVEATIVTKRSQVSIHGGGVNHHAASSTSYHVTFQVASGDRMELSVPGREYGMLVEGDRGILSFQGTRYLSFTRK